MLITPLVEIWMRVLVAIVVLSAALCGLWLACDGIQATLPQSANTPANHPSTVLRETLAAEPQQKRERNLVERPAIQTPPTAAPAKPGGQLLPYRILRVRAVDELGNAVPDVTLRLNFQFTVNGQVRDSWQAHDMPETDADGQTQWTYVRGVVPSAKQLHAAMLTPVLYGDDGAPVPVDLLDIPVEPVEIVIPPIGTMEIVLLGPDGRPWNDPASSYVVHLKSLSDPATGFFTQDSVELGRDGRAMVFPVRCGERFVVQLAHRATIRTTVDGPRHSGERVRVALQMVGLPILRGTVVDTTGRPVAGMLVANYAYEDGEGITSVAADKGGRFQTPVEEAVVGQTLTIKLRKPDERSYWKDRLATLTTDVPLRSGINEIGQLVLSETPLIVSGRVESADDTPIMQSVTTLDRTRNTAAALLQLAPRFRLDFARGSTPPDDPYRWERDYDLTPQALANGEFAVRGYPKSRVYRLRLMRGGQFLLMEPIEFTVGTEDLLVRVERAGEAKTTVLGDSAELLIALRIRLVPIAPQKDDDLVPEKQYLVIEGGIWRFDDNSRTVTWRGLAPGLHRLTVGYPGTPPIVELNDIYVPRGAPAKDPRLTIDLRGRLERIVITVLDSDGQRIPGARKPTVTIRGAGPETGWHREAVDRNGRVTLFVPGPVDLVVSAAGSRAMELSGVYANLTIHLQSDDRD